MHFYYTVIFSLKNRLNNGKLVSFHGTKEYLNQTRATLVRSAFIEKGLKRKKICILTIIFFIFEATFVSKLVATFQRKSQAIEVACFWAKFHEWF